MPNGLETAPTLARTVEIAITNAGVHGWTCQTRLVRARVLPSYSQGPDGLLLERRLDVVSPLGQVIYRRPFPRFDRVEVPIGPSGAEGRAACKWIDTAPGLVRTMVLLVPMFSTGTTLRAFGSSASLPIFTFPLPGGLS
jgi:hypothetical protein